MVTIPKAEEGSLSDEIESAEKDIESTELSLKEKKEKLEKLKAKKKERDEKFDPIMNVIFSQNVDLSVFAKFLLNKKK